MANFDPIYKQTIKNEGGFILENVEGDTGGQTYAGIARNVFPNWIGWKLIDKGDTTSDNVKQNVYDFYYTEFWKPVRGEEIKEQVVASNLFDFGVNAGVGTAIKLAQSLYTETPSTKMTDDALNKINAMTAHDFVSSFFIMKVIRYVTICNKNKTQSKFLLGWLNRAISEGH